MTLRLALYLPLLEEWTCLKWCCKLNNQQVKPSKNKALQVKIPILPSSLMNSNLAKP